MTTNTIAVRVERITREAQDVVSLSLESAGNGLLPMWTPGAHIDVTLGDGTLRQYSLCGDPADQRHWRIAVFREPASRGGSAYVHEGLTVGDVIRCGVPRNNFELVDAESYLFIAGGIGITPLLPMVRRCKEIGRPWQLAYGGRSATSMAFRAELAPFGDAVRFWPQDTDGMIDLDHVLAPPRAQAVYCCGPSGLIDAVEERCRSWPASSLHVERFHPKELDAEADKTAFSVYLQRSQVELTVPADQTLADVLEAAGADLTTSCREGTCGTCETVVLAGEPDHRDSYLTAAEQATNGLMMPCCSRARSARLVLDL